MKNQLILTKIIYKELSPRQQESYNFQTVSAILAEYGYSTIRLNDDWQGADFIAQHNEGEFLKVQLKGRLTLSKKYKTKDIYICFRYNNDWYLVNHDQLLNYFLERYSDTFAKSSSWVVDGNYSWNTLSKEILKILEEFKIGYTKIISDDNVDERILKNNQYFKKFMLSHRNFTDGTISKKDFKAQVNIPFDTDWNYLMMLVCTIEDHFQVSEFVSSHNYFRFAFENRRNVQDKQPTKFEAIYSCCYEMLREFWKQEKAPVPLFSRGGEPFDENDM